MSKGDQVPAEETLQWFLRDRYSPGKIAMGSKANMCIILVMDC